MDNTNKPAGESKNKKLFVILGLVLVVAVIVVAAVMMQPKGQSGEQGEEVNPNVPADAKPYLSEEEQATEPAPTPDGVEGEPMEGEEIAIPEILKEAVVVVEGANPISKEGKVITPEGNEVKNDAVPMSPEAPRQTPPVAKEELPASTIKLDISAAGWNPSEFTVKAGAPTTLAITSVDDFTHVFMFNDPSLSAVAVGVSPRETRAITFNAPSTPGEYPFVCDVPGHAGRGEVGKMIVE
jgi:plastocyanin